MWHDVDEKYSKQFRLFIFPSDAAALNVFFLFSNSDAMFQEKLESVMRKYELWLQNITTFGAIIAENHTDIKVHVDFGGLFVINVGSGLVEKQQYTYKESIHRHCWSGF